MKKTALILAALAAGFTARAEDAKSSYSVTLDFPYTSKYVFRGVEVATDAIQPSVEFSSGDFYAGIWTSVPLEKGYDSTKEIDFYGGYGIPLNDTWKMDVGATVYYYPESNGTTTTEAFVGVNGDVSGVSPSVYAYYDFTLEVFTLQGSLGYSIPLQVIGSSVDLSATLGWVNPDDSSSDDYVYYSLGASIPYKLAENATFTVGVNWSDTDIDGSDDAFWVTTGVSVGF